MAAMETRVVGIFVNKACPERWIAQDAEGNFWIPAVENPWDNREPFYPTEGMELEPVPGHYKYVLGIPG
jgi:hypothetical protein